MANAQKLLRGQKKKKKMGTKGQSNSERQKERRLEVPGRDSKKRGRGGGGVRN